MTDRERAAARVLELATQESKAPTAEEYCAAFTPPGSIGRCSPTSWAIDVMFATLKETQELAAALGDLAEAEAAGE